MDVFNKPAFLRRYKVQPGTNEPVDNRKLTKVSRTYDLCLSQLSFAYLFLFVKISTEDVHLVLCSVLHWFILTKNYHLPYSDFL